MELTTKLQLWIEQNMLVEQLEDSDLMLLYDLIAEGIARGVFAPDQRFVEIWKKCDASANGATSRKVRTCIQLVFEWMATRNPTYFHRQGVAESSHFVSLAGMVLDEIESDTKSDTEKKGKKGAPNRRVDAKLEECARYIKRNWAIDPDKSRLELIREYCDENGGSVWGLDRKFTAHPHLLD